MSLKVFKQAGAVQIYIERKKRKEGERKDRGEGRMGGGREEESEGGMEERKIS